MKKLILFAAAAVLLWGCAFADPLPLLEDLTGEITIYYNGTDSADGSFTYSYRYPAADPEHPDAAIVNSFFEYEVSDTISFRAPMDAEN